MLIVLGVSPVLIPVQASEDGSLNEEDLFSGTDIMVESEDLSHDTVAAGTGRPSFSVTGALYNTHQYATRRGDYILKTPLIRDDDTYTGDVTANLLLDARYREGIRSFANLDLTYHSQGIRGSHGGDTEYTDQSLQELFFDVNINRTVYLRIGKQHLKWGRNYFWNPTDLINLERKNFLDLDSNLEGTRGVKVTIPFGAKYNIYGFANLEDVDALRDVSWSLRFELLVGGRAEMAFSGWYRDGYEPVFGFDFSTRVFRMDVQGEMSLSYGENRDRLIGLSDGAGSISYTAIRGERKWIPKASIGLMKSLDLFDVNERVTVRGEFFYNHAGYRDNVFDDPVRISALLGSGLYEPNHVSRYYAALFTVIRRFIVSDAFLGLNAMANLTDGSGVLFASLSYNPWYDFYIELSASGFVGNGEDEYTFAGGDKALRLEFRYVF